MTMQSVPSDTGSVPKALTARDQWVCWRREQRDGKATKVPVDPSTGTLASTADPETWTGVKTALDHSRQTDVAGVGFVFTDDDPLVGVDLDDCRNPGSGTIDDWAREVILRLDSYSEVSPSGTGVHVIAMGELPDGRSRSGDIEMYATRRYFTVTGEHLDQTPTAVHRRSEELWAVHEDHVQPEQDTENFDDETGASADGDGEVDLGDDELLEKARAAENGDRFDALWHGRTSGYPSHSEADMALCLHLAFWTGGDAARMDRLFRQSGLMRAKWDEVHYADGATYGERTIERALETVDEVYEPDAESTDTTQKKSSPSPLSGPGEQTATESVHPSTGSDSIYLEERNRLLLEKVRSQQATIDRQATRIQELKGDLEAVQDKLDSAHRRTGTDVETAPSWWRFKRWLVES